MELPQSDIEILHSSRNAQGKPYKVKYLPLTKKDVKTGKGKNLGKGSYLNYYVGNTVVLVPNYDDANDEKANQILSELYPGREVYGINVIELYGNGGAIHCVTQQQPAA